MREKKIEDKDASEIKIKITLSSGVQDRLEIRDKDNSLAQEEIKIKITLSLERIRPEGR